MPMANEAIPLERRTFPHPLDRERSLESISKALGRKIIFYMLTLSFLQK